MIRGVERTRYPEARIEDVSDTLAGVSFPNPYQWLEQQTDAVRMWQREQAELASSHVREWPHFDRLKQQVQRFAVERRVDLPRFAGGRWFRARNDAGAPPGQVLVTKEPLGDGPIIFDVRSEVTAGLPFLSWISPSPDGRILAVGVCTDGSESNTIRLIDAESGRLLPDPPTLTLMDNWAGGAQWLPDSSGFFFSAIVGAATSFEQRVYLHRRLHALCTAPVDIAWTGVKECRMVIVSRDGKYAVAFEGMNRTIPVAIADLTHEPLQWRPFVTDIPGMVAGHVVHDRYIAVTDIGAERGRLVAVPLNCANPNDPSLWEELCAESEAVLRSVTLVGESLYLNEFVDTYAHIRVVDLNGRHRGEVPLPGRGAISEMAFPIGNLVPRGHPDQFLFAFSSLTESWGIYSHTPGGDAVEMLQAPQIRIADAVIEDRWAVSADGTRVPYHIVRGAPGIANQPTPTLIYAYGGFNVPLVPQFPGMMAAFVSAGGSFVHAHLRGGGEFGLDWWHQGRHLHKQNSFDDLYAIAEDLIAQGRCTPQSLGFVGGSNGGLVAGVAITQRPELWGAVVPRVPRLDLIGACKTAYGRRSTLEDRTPNPDDPGEARRLAAISPYHLVKDGVSYPAVYIDAGETDPRCPPQDARKFAARLQHATAGNSPVLLHVWENVGHGWATDKDTAVNEYTEWLAFALMHLGLDDWP